MPYLLRRISNNTSWDRNQFPGWVPQDDLPSCIVRDLGAGGNALSVWEIPDGETNLAQVITALASTRKILRDNFDFALLSAGYVDGASFVCSPIPGKTPYTAINSCHRDLSNLTLGKLTYFAHLLCKYGIFRRIGWKELRALLLDAIANNRLDLGEVPPELKQELGVADATS